jgi:predicted transcriptional regulator
MMHRRTFAPMTVSIDDAMRRRLANIASEAKASRTAVVQLALEEFFGRRHDATIALELRRRGAAKRRVVRREML